MINLPRYKDDLEEVPWLNARELFESEVENIFLGEVGVLLS